MRLDKYLKVSRIIKRRTIAKDACDAGRVSVNSKIAKSSYEIKENDIIGIRFGEKTTNFKVLSIKETVSKNDASSLYEIVE